MNVRKAYFSIKTDFMIQNVKKIKEDFIHIYESMFS